MRLPALLLLLAVVLPAADQAPLPVFVLAGQSNMVGLGQVSELPDELKRAQPDVLLFEQRTWTPLEPGKVPEGRSFGPEVTFGQAMAKHVGGPIGLIKVAASGTDLAVQWNPQGKGVFARLVKQVQAARQSRPIMIMGMIWMQGEADSKEEAMAKAYQVNLENLVLSARRAFAVTDLPFVCGRVNAPAAGKYTHVALVRAAQEAVKLPGYRMVDCDGVAKGHDDLHYSAAGQQELGKRFAAAQVELLGFR